jgi:hypothetical protein
MSDILPFPGLKTDAQKIDTPTSPGADHIAPFHDLWPGTRRKRHAALEKVRDWVRGVLGCENTTRVIFDLLAGRLDEWELSHLLKTSRAEVASRVAACHDLLWSVGVAEVVVATLDRQPVARIDPRSARILDLDGPVRFAVPEAEGGRVLPAPEKCHVADYLREHVKAIRRQRVFPLELLARFNEDDSVALDLVTPARTLSEAKKLTRRRRNNRIINLTVEFHEPLSRRAS